MSANPVIRIDFIPAEADAERRNGWGSGALFLQGSPYWHGSGQNGADLISWTWVDFLEYVGANWAYLVSEQNYPFPWLNRVSHPGELWDMADARWARLGDDLADTEEPALLAFERRHNLASAWKGISLPGLTWLRNGSIVWICADGKAPIRARFSECKDELIRVCDAMASAFGDSDNPRVSRAVKLWGIRGEALCQNFVSIATGLSPEVLLTIQGSTELHEFWGVAANSSWNNGEFEEGELLAAARMTAGLLNAEALSSVLRAVRKLPKHTLAALDDLSSKASYQLRKQAPQYAFLAGYIAAEFVREKAPTARGKYFDVNDALHKLNVEVRDIAMQTDSIDAVAVWGSHGPCVVLNKDRAHSQSVERTRMTLAHELGHLIMDRQGGLPFCEVLGGAVDDFMEKRASAFAAELLLPRTAVEFEWTQWRRTFTEFLGYLKHDYGVSKSVACAQVYNSTVFRRLDRRDQERVEARLRLEERLLSHRPVRVETAGGII